jgi:glycosyltransferase involved in cell wall biosynthesis
MKIGFLTTHLGVFGSVRELIENANGLIDLGHEVKIYNKTNIECKWLPCKAEIVQFDGHLDIKSDVLILMDSPFPDLFEIFIKSDSRFKTMIMMGFDPDNFELTKEDNLMDNVGKDATQTQRNLVHILKNYVMCADGWWQIDYFESLGLPRGFSIGGINLSQFKNYNRTRMVDIGFSGDSRPRKGTGVLLEAIRDLPYTSDSYWKKGDQSYLVDFLNNCTLFIDNHVRAGWCNPVLEAMACGCVVICNNIGAVQDFAIDGQTARVLEVNTAHNFNMAIKQLFYDKSYRILLQQNALNKVEEFDYKVTVPKFAEFLENQL